MHDVRPLSITLSQGKHFVPNCEYVEPTHAVQPSIGPSGYHTILSTELLETVRPDSFYRPFVSWSPNESSETSHSLPPASWHDSGLVAPNHSVARQDKQLGSRLCCPCAGVLRRPERGGEEIRADSFVERVDHADVAGYA